MVFISVRVHSCLAPNLINLLKIVFVVTRQLLRIAHRMSVYPPDESRAYETVQQTFLAKFLPSLPRAALENAIENVSITRPKSSKTPTTTIQVENDTLKIGSTSTKRYQTDALTKVPDIVFYDVPQHVQVGQTF